MVKCSRVLNHEILFLFDLFTSIDPSTRSLSCRNVSITQPSGWWWTVLFLLCESMLFFSIIRFLFYQDTLLKGVKWKHTQWRTMWTIQGTPQPERSLRLFTPSCRHDMKWTSASTGLFVVWPQISLSSSLHLLQDKDFKLLKPGDPIFMKFSGETVSYEGQELYSFFINECAYYEKKIAFILGEKVRLNLPPISVK